MEAPSATGDVERDMGYHFQAVQRCWEPLSVRFPLSHAY
ncbi:hypothetical protein I552_9646 [Mycobacterium xenopi 3993]|nr:hypothetical protein I552_9646 [Mycobacterium xenopi 3993]